MILELAILHIIPGNNIQFEKAFHQAQSIISSMPGYISHELHRCLDEEGKYILLVHWQSIKDHTEGFRKSQEYQEWKRILHHFYNPFPTVEHYTCANKSLQE